MSLEPEMGLAETKLQSPALPVSLVARARLDQRLDSGVDGHVRLILVSAPAGSGKSTLLASWLAGRSDSSAWLQIEESDADPVRFWTYLAQAVDRARPGIWNAVRPAIEASNGDGDAIVSALVTALTRESSRLVIVLDDYHLITGTDLHLDVERLISLCPPSVTLVISTRFDPPFRLSRLRVRNHVVEIRTDDLRFQPDEAGGLLGEQGQALGERNIETLLARTEGWAAGLVLAGFSLDRSTDPDGFVAEFHGDDQMVVSYLSDEFLASLDEIDRVRLVAMSAVDQFNGALVDAITGSTDGQQWIRITAATNQLLIGLDRTGEWFRYHHLLRDLLRAQADETISDQVPELHRRAAAWFESAGDRGRAFRHWLLAGDRNEAGRLMFTYGSQLLSEGQIRTLRKSLEGLGNVARESSWCALLWGWCEFIDGRYSLAQEWVEVVRDVAPDDFDSSITTPLEMNIFLGRGDVTSALQIARELAAPARLDALFLEQAVVAGGVFMWAGLDNEARAILTYAVQSATLVEVKTPRVLALVYHAIIEFERGDAAAGGLAAQLALDTAHDLGIGSYYRLGPAYAIRARTASVDAEAVADSLRAVELVRATTGDLALAYVLTMCGDTLIDLGDSQGEAWLIEARVVVDRCPDPGIAGRYLDRVESRHGVADLGSVPEVGLVEHLTERETAVLRYLPTNLSQREIAAELFVSQNTVKTHCGAIYRKLAVSNRKAAVQAARDLGVL